MRRGDSHLRVRTSRGLLQILLILLMVRFLMTVCLAESHRLEPSEVESERANEPSQFVPIDEAAKSELDQLMQYAVAHHPEIQAVEQGVAQSQGSYRQSSLRPNPSLEFEVGTDIEAARAADRGVSVGYAHPFELGDKRQRRMNLAEEEITIAQYELSVTRRNVTGRLRRTFLQALALHRTITDHQELSRTTKGLVDIVNQRLEQGETAAVDVYQARVEDSRVRAELELLKGRRRALLESIRSLAGFEVGRSIRVVGNIEPRKPPLSVNELVARALELRPDLKAVRAELGRVKAEIEMLDAQNAPNIIGFLRYSYSRSAFDLYGLNDQGNLAPIRDLDHALSAGIAFDLPVRDRNQGKLAMAAAQSQAIRLRVKALELSAREEVVVAYERYSTALNSLSIFQDEVLEQARASLNTLQGAYEMGEISFSEVLHEQRRLSELQRAYNDVFWEFAEAAADLAQASAAPIP